MLGSLLDKLGSFFSKNFFTNCIPLLFFLFVHGWTAYYASTSFQQWVGAKLQNEIDHPALVSFGLLLAISVFAYVFSTLNTFFRELLEGNYLPQRIVDGLSQRYRDRLAEVNKQYDGYRRAARLARRKKVEWVTAMGDAMQKGFNTGTCAYKSDEALKELFSLQQANQEVEIAKLEAAVQALMDTLEKNSAELVNDQQSVALDADHGQLLRLIDYWTERLEAKVVKYFNEIQFSFAGNDVRATKMGTIAARAAYYADSRYSLNLNFFWSRLQKFVEADATFYADLQDTKSQLDFLVSLFWQTIFFTFFWLAFFPFTTGRLWVYLLIVSAGPLFAWGWYRIALRNYGAFSDLMRAAVDLYRAEFLKALGVRMPASTEEEKLLWTALELRLGFNDSTNILFKAPS